MTGRARISEIIRLRVDHHILEDGVLIERGKGSLSEITEWTPRLRKAVDQVAAVRSNPGCSFLLQTKKGKAYKSYSSVKGIWRNLMDTAIKSGALPKEKRFTHKDMKAKGTSDHHGLMQRLKTLPDPKISGHKTASAQKHYIRKPLKNKGTR